MNNVRHKCPTTVGKNHFALVEARPLGALFWACELNLSLF